MRGRITLIIAARGSILKANKQIHYLAAQLMLSREYIRVGGGWWITAPQLSGTSVRLYKPRAWVHLVAASALDRGLKLPAPPE